MSTKEEMLHKPHQRNRLETFDDFDNGLSDLLDFWASSASKTDKEKALANFKEDLENAVLQWADNRAKTKKYAAIARELAEFEEALK